MANTILQNSQRGVIFLTWMIITTFFVFIVIRIAKKLIDTVEEDGKYADGEVQPQKKKQEAEVSNQNFAQAAINETSIKQDDTTLVKAVKKMIQFENFILPIMIVIPLNIITGTSKAFCLVFYIFILIVVVLFNLIGIHRSCCEHKCVRVLFDNLWIIMLLFQILNIWTTSIAAQPYVLIQQ